MLHVRFCSLFLYIVFPLLLVVSVLGIVDGVVQAAAFLAFHGLAGDEVAHVDHVAQLADVLGGLHTFEELFRLFVKQIQTGSDAFQAQVAL